MFKNACITLNDDKGSNIRNTTSSSNNKTKKKCQMILYIEFVHQFNSWPFKIVFIQNAINKTATEPPIEIHSVIFFLIPQQQQKKTIVKYSWSFSCVFFVVVAISVLLLQQQQQQQFQMNLIYLDVIWPPSQLDPLYYLPVCPWKLRLCFLYLLFTIDVVDVTSKSK